MQLPEMMISRFPLNRIGIGIVALILLVVLWPF